MKVFLISAAAAFFSTAAWAADIVIAPEPVQPFWQPAPVFSWQGGYAGLQAGGGFADADFSYPGKKGHHKSFTESLDGGYVGGFVGWNFGLGPNLILGLEGDVSYNFNDTPFGYETEIGTDWAYGMRARFGYAHERALIFASGGWAATRAYLDAPYGGTKDTFHGWSLGAGVDYAFTDRTFGRVEYRYNDYGNKTINGIGIDLSQHVVGIGIGMKF